MQNIDYDLEYENAIKKMALGGETSILFKIDTPTGAPSKLTYIQQLLVRTKAFKEWFGDWENDPKNASQVIDENGEPLVVYHGTYAKEPFYTFDLEKADLGFHFGTKEQAKNRSTTKFFIEGFKSYVNSYFLNIKPLFEVSDIGAWEYPQRYIDMLISDNIINENIAKEKGFLSAYYREDNVKIREYIKSKYGDSVGFIYNNKYEGDGKSFIVLSPNQIKLADGRNTEFSALNNDIRYDEGGEINKNFTPIFKWRMMDIRQEDGSIKEVPMHDFFLWIYDDVEAEQKLKDGIYEYPYPTIQFNDDLEAIWKDNKFKKYKGNKHIISFIYGKVDEYFQKEGYYKLEIDVMTTKPNFRRQGVNEFAIKYLREKFKLNKEQVEFELPTEQGKLFISSSKYEKGGLIAPNGNKSNLTPEQYKLVRTPEFKKWFGDWENDPENASQVVDENGEPLVVYHYSNVDFNLFRTSGDIETLSGLVKNYGAYFTNNVSSREFYFKNKGDYEFECFLKIINPYYTNNYRWSMIIDDKKLLFLKENNYDGVMSTQTVIEYVILHSNQIKLADGTNTTFDNESNDIRYAEGGEVNFDKIISSSSRFKPSDTIVFDPPLLGKNGTKLVAYQWKYTIESSFNKEGEEYGKRVSDWAQAEESAETGRDLVHVFDIEMPDGSKKSVSSESVLSIMGFVDKDTKKVFGNLATASKTLAKQQMKLAILEAQQKQYDEAKREFENIKKPTIKIAKLNELPLVIQKTIEKESDRIYFSMGDVVRPQDLPYNQYILFKDLDNLDENKYKPTKNTIEDLESTWILKRLNANNIKAPYGLYDLKNRVQRQKNKVEKMLSSDNKYAEGGKTKNMDRYEHLLGIQKPTPKFAEGGSVATEHGLTNSGKKGGYFEGKSHAEGGIKAWNSTTNSPIEVEGGEVIITKKAVEDDELYEFEGEMLTNKQILSKINESGGGVKFEDGGEVNQCNCSGKMYKFGGETMEDYQIMNKINSTYNKKQGMKNHKTSYGHNLMRKMKEGGYC